MRMDENAFEAVSEAVRPHRYAFLVDALVLANIHGAAEPSVLESLAALSHILGLPVHRTVYGADSGELAGKAENGVRQGSEGNDIADAIVC